MAAYRMTARRRIALRKAQAASARKRKRDAKNKARTRTTYKGGLAYQTRTTRNITNPKRRTHYTKAYRRGQLIGYAQSVSSKKKATIDDIYVAPPHRGTGVSKNLLLHQAHAVRGKKVQVTHLRSLGGDKLANRTKIRGVNPTVKKRRSNPDQISGIMEFAWSMQTAAHSKQYRKAQMSNHKARVRGRKIKTMTKIGA